MVTTVFYESVEEEEILFQPQDMNVQYIDIERLRSNLIKAEERARNEEMNVEVKVEKKVEKKVEATVQEKKEENIIGFKRCPITNRMTKGIKFGGGVYWKPIETHKPTNYEILMNMCEMYR